MGHTSRNEIIKFGITLPIWPLEDIFWVSEFADKNRFSVVSLIDHIASPESLYIAEAFVTLTSIASSTKKIRIMTGVSDPHRRHPALMAQSIATLDRISNGRFTLGIGAGEAMNLDPYGIPRTKPVSKLQEYIQILRLLWQSEHQPVNYEGEFFKLKNAVIGIESVQKPCPPIWIGALSPRTLEMTGRLGDGWYPTAITSNQYEEKLQLVRNSAKKYGRAPDEYPVPAVEIALTVAKDHATAENQMLPLGRAYLALFPEQLSNLGYSTVIGKEFGLQNLVLTKDTRDALSRVSANIPIGAVDQLCGYGTPDECINFIEKYIKSGTEVLNIIPMGDNSFVKETILPLLAEKVLPYFGSS